MTGPTQTPPCPECAPGAAEPHTEPSQLHVHLTPYGYLLYTPGHERPSFIEEMREAAYRAGREDAIAELAATDHDCHYIEFRPGGWTIQHPLACRPDLFNCPVNRAAEHDLTEPPEVLGRFECELNDLGDRLLNDLRDRLLIGDRADGKQDPERSAGWSAGEPDRGEGEWDAHDRAEHNAQLQAHRDEYGPEVEAERQAEGPSLYAYRCAEDMDYTVAREKGVPVTGWLHAGGGPPWRVLVAESREQADVFHPPHTTIEAYDGDEPTILITEAYPMLFPQSDQP